MLSYNLRFQNFNSFKNYFISLLYLFNVIDQGLSLELITQSAGNQLYKIDLAHTLLVIITVQNADIL